MENLETFIWGCIIPWCIGIFSIICCFHRDKQIVEADNKIAELTHSEALKGVSVKYYMELAHRSQEDEWKALERADKLERANKYLVREIARTRALLNLHCPELTKKTRLPLP
jgi:galactokinase